MHFVLACFNLTWNDHVNESGWEDLLEFRQYMIVYHFTTPRWKGRDFRHQDAQKVLKIRDKTFGIEAYDDIGFDTCVLGFVCKPFLEQRRDLMAHLLTQIPVLQK